MNGSSFVVATHGGSFHADEALAIARIKAVAQGGARKLINSVLDCLGKVVQVVRTRDKAVLGKIHQDGGVLVDVGGENDDQSKLDHHFAPVPLRSNGVPYGAFGLTTKALGLWADDELCLHVDAIDNGVRGQPMPSWWPDLTTTEDKIERPSVAWTLGMCNPVNISGEPVKPEEFDKRFEELTNLLKPLFAGIDGQIISGEARGKALDGLVKGISPWIENSRKAEQASRERVSQAAGSLAEGQRFVVFENYEPAAVEVLAGLPPEHPLLYFLYPSPSGDWMVQQIAVRPGSFEGRKPLPKAWAGMRDEGLRAATGIEDAVFVHPNGFVGGCRSKEGACQLAELSANA